LRRLVRKPVPFALGIIAFACLALLPGPLQHFEKGGVDFGRRPALAAAAAVLMAIWWISEATSIYLTALVPLVLFPLLGVFGEGLKKTVAGAVLPYFDGYIFLFLGGMGIAAAMQQWSLHSRIALNILRAIGTRPPLVLLGMLLATACVSLWISNTATAAMMLPIGIALITQIEKQSGGGRREFFGGSLMLAIAYGANVGGMGTKIGTGPNMLFSGFVSENCGRDVTFFEFLCIGLPFVIIFLPVVWAALWLQGRRDAPQSEAGGEVIQRELEALGRPQRGEWAVLLTFLLAAALWISSQPLYSYLSPLVGGAFSALKLKFQSKHVEAGIAMAAMLSLLCLPVGGTRGPSALNFQSLRLIPWESLILLGGSFGLAEGVEASGLSKWMGDQVGLLATFPVFVQFLGVSLATVYFGAIASNVATTAVMLVVLKSSSAMDSIPLLATATLAASCDFMLPAGTPPNAIVFGSGYLTIPRMARIGFFLDLSAAVLLALWGSTGIRWVLG
jgi:sodium-dependent dicarboxylate transporter 2/3/5